MSVLSFNFNDVKGPSNFAEIPVNVPLYATVDNIELSEFNGQTKFVLNQTVYFDPTDDSRTENVKTYIGPKHGWLLAQYLAAADQDFRSLSGQGLSAESLESVLVGQPLEVTFRESKYADRVTGAEKVSKQITVVRKAKL